MLIQAAWSDAVVEESNLSVQIAALRKLLGPQPDGSEWIATIPRAGYRFVGTVHVVVPALDGGSPVASQPDLRERPSIVVLPFANVSGNKEQEYLADGITEDIITALRRFRWFRVIGRNSSFVYKGKSVDSKHVARDLGVRYVLVTQDVERRRARDSEISGKRCVRSQLPAGVVAGVPV